LDDASRRGIGRPWVRVAMEPHVGLAAVSIA